MSKLKRFQEDVRQFWGYLLARDMGEMGEGCLMTIGIWIFMFIVISAIISTAF